MLKGTIWTWNGHGNRPNHNLIISTSIDNKSILFTLQLKNDHESLESPPDYPVFKRDKVTEKKKPKSDLEVALTEAAKTLVESGSTVPSKPTQVI